MMEMLHTISVYLSHMHPIVYIIVISLLFASLLSWSAIIHQFYYLYRLERHDRRFYTLFDLHQDDLVHLYQNLHQPNLVVQGLSHLFHVGFSRFQQAQKHQLPQQLLLQDVERSTNIWLEKYINRLESPLTLLGTIASVSPYVGLLGTVWGIMHTLQALGYGQHSMQIATVAPGIAEALMTTAFGLLTAIPANIAYNYCANRANRVSQRYERFQQQWITQLSILCHQNRNKSREISS